MDSNSQLDELLAEFKERFGYELDEKDDDLRYVLFKRIVNGGDTHVVILEDHRWELEANFDPEIDVGDWLIFSEIKNGERDWFGHYIDTQYPLTYEEYKLIEKIIHELEKPDEG